MAKFEERPRRPGPRLVVLLLRPHHGSLLLFIRFTIAAVLLLLLLLIFLSSCIDPAPLTPPSHCRRGEKRLG
jgi:hypothetical protein